MSDEQNSEPPKRTPTVIFDFDGTVALGNGPVIAFGVAASEHMAEPDVVAEIRAALDAFEAGTSDANDGYGAVTSVVAARGMSRADISAAYLSSRAHLGTDLAPVTVPDGLAPFLRDLGTVADIWLATNAPADGVARVLEAGGIADSFSQTHFDVGKPDGLTPIVAAALEGGPVLSVGDIYANDLAPAAALGADTALVGSTTDRETNTVTMRAELLQDLYPQIRAWAARAASEPGASTDAP